MGIFFRLTIKSANLYCNIVSERGLPVQPGPDDVGPELLRVQGQVQGPQGQGPRHVLARLDL